MLHVVSCWHVSQNDERSCMSKCMTIRSSFRQWVVSLSFRTVKVTDLSSFSPSSLFWCSSGSPRLCGAVRRDWERLSLFFRQMSQSSQSSMSWSFVWCCDNMWARRWTNMKKRFSHMWVVKHTSLAESLLIGWFKVEFIPAKWKMVQIV